MSFDCGLGANQLSIVNWNIFENLINIICFLLIITEGLTTKKYQYFPKNKKHILEKVGCPKKVFLLVSATLPLIRTEFSIKMFPHVKMISFPKNQNYCPTGWKLCSRPFLAANTDKNILKLNNPVRHWHWVLDNFYDKHNLAQSKSNSAISLQH